jgi:hypothetical protein
VNAPTPRRLWKYATQQLGLKRFFRHPGDGRPQGTVPAQALYWSMLIGQLLRETSFHGVEALACSSARGALHISVGFSDDALGYFTERLHPNLTRQAAVQAVLRAKRNKAFDGCAFIGLAIDGSTGGRCRTEQCPLCRPFRNQDKEIAGYRHHWTMIGVVGCGLSLPFDIEPYGPGDSEYAAGQRLLQRAVANLGPRFADYVVVDGGFATAPFLNVTTEVGLKVVARLKGNLPELFTAAQKRFRSQPPSLRFRDDNDRVEIWDADDFDPWESLTWETVRVIRYRQTKPDGEVVEAYWLTNFSRRRVSGRALYRMAKSRWEIENQGFNDAKNRHGMEHICHHHPNSLLLQWLITALALTIERLYRLRFLHRGNHPLRSAIDLVRLLWISLGQPVRLNTS